MKQLLITIAAVVLVGCGESQQSATAPEAKPESATVKVPDISIHEAAEVGNIEAIKQHIAAGTDVNAKQPNGKTPLDLAIASDARKNDKRDQINVQGSQLAELLRKHVGKTGAELKAAGN